MKQENKAKINAIIQTLNQISVCGRNNMDMLLGCIMALEGVLADEQIVENKEEAEDNG